MDRMKRYFLGAVFVALVLRIGVHAQNQQTGNAPVVQIGNPIYYTTPISSTAAVNTATTLTIPAAAGLYNYVCSLAFEVNNDNTATAVSNVVSTSTNFNSFAVKFSQPATASVDTYVSIFNATPGTGCVKSTVAGTATTFVSPGSVTHSAWTWYASYYQAP